MKTICNMPIKRMSVVIALFLLCWTLVPGISSAEWVRVYHFALVEYGDPAIARPGELDIWYDNNLPNTPYGYPYLATMHVNGICYYPNINLHSGDVLAWIYSIISDYSIIRDYDAYSEWAVVMPYAYNGIPQDGSWGKDYPAAGCPGGTEARHGFLALFVRFSEYQVADSSGIHVADLYDCSDELGCNWYYVYQHP